MFNQLWHSFWHGLLAAPLNSALVSFHLQMHNDAERFHPRTEQVFKILPVISACAMSFAHGSNDIANSIGSFSAAYYVYQNMKVPGSNAEVR